MRVDEHLDHRLGPPHPIPSASAPRLRVLLERGQQQPSPLGVEADAGAAGRPQPTVAAAAREQELGQATRVLAPAGDDHALATAVLDLDPRAAASPLGVGSIQPLDNHPLEALLRGDRKQRLALVDEVPRHHQRRAVERQVGEQLTTSHIGQSPDGSPV